MATNKKNLSYGLGSPLIDVFPTPIASQRAPLISDKMEVGQVWVDQPNDDVYVLTRILNNNAQWLGVGGGTGTFASLNVSPGNITAALGDIRATAGALSAGTTVTGATGVIATTGGVTASAGNVSATLGNVNAGGSVGAGTTVTSGTLMTAGDALTVTTGLVTITDLATAGILSNTAAGVVQSTAGTAGQVIMGATGAAPAWGTIGSIDGSVAFAPGANSLDLSASGVDMTIHTDGADATEAANAVTIAGTANEIVTAGAGSTITLSFTADPQIADTLTVGTGLTVTAGGALVSAGNIVATLGGITADAGNIAATLGSVAAGTTVTAGTGFSATAGGFNGTGDSKIYGEIMAEANSADATGERISMQKSRAGAVITTGDSLGQLGFWGHDGTNYIAGAYLKSVSSGTIATDRIPADLQFYTSPDSVVVATLRMDIDTAGKVTIAAPDAGTGLTVAGGGLSSTGGIEEATNDITVTTATKGIILPGTVKIISGSGSPHGSVTSPKGSLYLRTDGSGVADRLWVNTNAGTDWASVTTSS